MWVWTLSLQPGLLSLGLSLSLSVQSQLICSSHGLSMVQLVLYVMQLVV